MGRKDLMTESLVVEDHIRNYRQQQGRNKLLIALTSVTFVTLLTSIAYLYLFRPSLPNTFKIFIITGKDSSTSYPVNFDTGTKSTTKNFEYMTRDPSCIIVSDSQKFDCYPDAPVSQEQCERRGCCYYIARNSILNMSESSFPPLGTPWCFYPAGYNAYEVKTLRKTKQGYEVSLQRGIPSGFPKDVQRVSVDIANVDENTVRIKITDLDSKRFEAPLINGVTANFTGTSKKYDVYVFVNGTLTIRRKSTGAAVFDTELTRLVFSDQFLQISTKLSTCFVYGLGEHYDRLLKSVNWTRTTLFNRDNWPRPNVMLYGTHPFYLALEKDHSSHGVFLLNSNSMDVILQPTPALTFRPIGGILDLFVFLGPSPTEVVQQYTNIIERSFMPPYWSLGFQLCKFGYNSLNETIAVWERTRAAGIPYDVQWNDIDYMDKHNDFTYDKTQFSGLPEYVEMLHKVGMHYVCMTDPGISNAEKPGSYPPYDDGVKDDIFVKNSTGGIFVGKVWNSVSTVFPDFSHPNAQAYWTKQMKDFHDIVNFDGSWIDMNEPSNFYDGTKHGCPNTSLENPQYVPGGFEPLRSRTVCMSAKHYNTTHYNEHNLYAFREAKATYHALANITQKRPFVISRASFPGLGYYSGHWSGDIGSNWEDMRYSVSIMLNFNMFGISMMGSDICGFRDNATVELCARWQALGAFYPFSRNHNSINQRDQDPVALGQFVVDAARNTLIIRYNLLPYLYFLFYESHAFGKTVARPLFFEFTDDPQTYNIDEQFMWGSALMIMPALYEGVTNITVYFPKATWYDYYTGEKLDFYGETAILPAPLDTINLAFRGGCIIPQQHYAMTTTESRLNNFFLWAFLSEKNTAVGELYWDDGESIDSYEKLEYNLIGFNISDNVMSSEILHADYATQMELDNIKICGLQESPTRVTLNGEVISYSFDQHNCFTVSARISLLEKFVLTWN